MRRRWIVVAAAVASTSLAVSPALATDEPTARSSATGLVQQLRKLLPADHQARRASAGLDADPAALSVIDPDDYECSQDTPFYNWVNAQVAGWTMEQLLGAQTILEYDVADLDAAFFPEPKAARFFGADGEYTKRLTKDFARLRGFWDIPSGDIELVPVHGGSAILDTARSARAIEAGLGLSPEDAATAAAMLKQLADQDIYQHGDLPLFTVNAFALTFTPEQPAPPGADDAPKVLMGDGVLEAARAIGFDDIAPDVIVAHEFGHHVQFQNGESDVETTPEASRRLELMADGLAAYYLGHPRGGHASWRRIRQTVEFASNIGDCQFGDPTHHGTPNQRGRSAEWGAKLAQAGKRVLPGKRVIELFDRKLPRIVAPDAPDTITITSTERTAVA